jgi:hypothetical protein
MAADSVPQNHSTDHGYCSRTSLWRDRIWRAAVR